MANIKVNITGKPYTGRRVTFPAPCSCDQVTGGLVINGETYTVCDTMGNRVTGRGGVWIAGAQVSVVLDCEQKKAFIQSGSAPSNSGSGSGPVGATSIDIVLSASAWSNKAQTISNAEFSASGYDYIVSPTVDSAEAYTNARIRADNVTTDGKITFRCESVPTTSIAVKVLKFGAVDSATGDGSGTATGGGIVSIAQTVTSTEDNGRNEITVTLSDGSSSRFYVRNGSKGNDGVGVQSVARTSGTGAAGTTDTYTMTMTDGTTYDFTVYNGRDGANGSGGSGGGADGADGITPHIDETTGHWFIGDTDTGVRAEGRDGEDGADGITPHIDETTGHWFIGDTDTGVKATNPDGSGNTVIRVATLTSTGWNTDTMTQTIAVEGVLADEFGQVITIEPKQASVTAYEEADVYCVSNGVGTLTFEARTIPTVDLEVYVVLEDVVGGSANVYSTEDTVIGTWIDGKPIYRRTLLFVAVQGDNLLSSGAYVDTVVHAYGQMVFNAEVPININAPGIISANDCSFAETAPYEGIPELFYSASGAFAGKLTTLTYEYTKTTDIATIAIPSTTALMNAYVEGVDEA